MYKKPYVIYERGKKPRIPYKQTADATCRYCSEKHDYEHSKEFIRRAKAGEFK